MPTLSAEASTTPLKTQLSITWGKKTCLYNGHNRVPLPRPKHLTYTCGPRLPYLSIPNPMLESILVPSKANILSGKMLLCNWRAVNRLAKRTYTRILL